MWAQAASSPPGISMPSTTRPTSSTCRRASASPTISLATRRRRSSSAPVRYSTPLTTSLARQLNPLAITTQTLPWSDPNRDGIVQDSELDLTRLPSNFGVRQVARLDPNLKRETNTELMLGVQHELAPRLAVFANWFRRAYSNKRVIDDLNRNFSDYRAVEVVSPYNGELMTLYDLTSTAVLSRPVDQVIRNAAWSEVYNGFEWGADLRIPGGGRLFA